MRKQVCRDECILLIAAQNHSNQKKSIGWQQGIDAIYAVCKQMQTILGKLTDDEIMTDQKGIVKEHL